MKRLIIASMAAAMATLAAASAYAADEDLRTTWGRQHFWQQHQPESGGN